MRATLQDHMQKQETKFYRIICKNKKPKTNEKLFTFANVRQKYAYHDHLTAAIGLTHDDVLLINFTTTPHSHALFARFFHLHSFSSFFTISILWEHICISNARLAGEINQQNVIMQKAYCNVSWTIHIPHALLL